MVNVHGTVDDFVESVAIHIALTELCDPDFHILVKIEEASVFPGSALDRRRVEQPPLRQFAVSPVERQSADRQ